MPFVIPIGRYLGIRRGTDVVNPVTPVRDPDANYAVVQLANGQTAAPEQAGVLLEAASKAPELGLLLRQLPALAEQHPSKSADVLKEELDLLLKSGLLIALDPSKDGLSDAFQKAFLLVPVQPIQILEQQLPRFEPEESDLKEYEAGGAVFGLHRGVADEIINLPAEGRQIDDVIGRIAQSDRVADQAQATALMVLGLQPLLVSQAVALVARTN